ncbi:MAG: LacI family DNA-binding transcriptional regulator [Planctomycetota bacterium]
MSEKKSFLSPSKAADTAEILEVLRLTPFPAKGAVNILQAGIRTYLQNAQVEPGTAFPTDPEVAEVTQLSRSTVWRALSQLQREGWLIREPGRGTFVGPSAELGHASANPLRRDVTRLAILINNIADLSRDWFIPGLLGGIESVADRFGVRCELVGQRECDVETFVRRLSRSRPDVVSILSFGDRPGLLTRELSALSIPVVRVGRQYVWNDAPCIMANNGQGAELALEHLQQAGHHRIGLLMRDQGLPWVVERLRAFMSGLQTDRTGLGNEMVHWIAADDSDPGHVETPAVRDEIERLKAYLLRAKPTAILCGSSPLSRLLSLAVAELGLVIPDDLSVVSFDQNPLVDAWFGRSITSIQLPLEEMGRTLADWSTRAARGETLPESAILDFNFHDGHSVSKPKP